MNLKTQSSDRFRLTCIFLFQIFLFCLIIAKFFKIQILEGRKWEDKALSQHKKIETIPYKRGAFYSNTLLKGAEKIKAFAFDVPKFHIYIDPLKIPKEKKNVMMQKLFSLIETPLEKQKKIEKDFYKQSHYRKLYSFIDRSDLEKVQDWWSFFNKENKIASNALFSSLEFQRSYPFTHSLGQVLHTVLKERDSKTNKAIPTGGLELFFHRFLEGKPGKKTFVRSLKNRLDEEKILTEKEDGADVYLTINHYLQSICEEELEKGVKTANAKGGWAVMMDPYTGSILALAQYPFFNPSLYPDYFNQKKLEEHTRCKAVVDTFEPGSIFKPIILALAMSANEELLQKGQSPIFSPEEKVSTKDGSFPGIRLKDGRCHFYMNMDIALQRSANIYMGKIMQKLIDKMGDLWLKEKLEYLGFGRKTGVELPAEAYGMIPTPGKLHPNGALEWSKPTPFSLAIGHNLLANSVQIASSYCTIANGGYKVTPSLIRKIVKKNTKEIHTDKPSIKKVLSSTITKRIKQSLKFVTKPGGTARLGDIPYYTEAGKSGTSEKIVEGKYSHKLYISSFIGFSPCEDPKFVLMIVVDEPEKKWIPGKGTNHLGGVCAAPIFAKIGERTLHYLGITPDDPLGYSNHAEKADMKDEIKRLKKTYADWNKK